MNLLNVLQWKNDTRRKRDPESSLETNGTKGPMRLVLKLNCVSYGASAGYCNVSSQPQFKREAAAFVKQKTCVPLEK